VLAWIYNATGGSLLLTGLAHAAVNGWPMPWNAALLALPQEARPEAVASFHSLITTATAVIAVLVVLAAGRRLGVLVWRTTPIQLTNRQER